MPNNDYREINKEQARMAIRVAWAIILVAISLSVLFLTMSTNIIIGIIKK